MNLVLKMGVFGEYSCRYKYVYRVCTPYVGISFGIIHT